MPELSHAKYPDSSLAVLADPYRFISKECRRLGCSLFQTRLLLRPNICMMGPEAAAMFYEQGRLWRRGAVLKRFEKTLFGEGGVQGLDDEAHRHRKQLFMSSMSAGESIRLAKLSADEWEAYSHRWQSRERVVLHHEVREILYRAVFAWAGLPVDEAEVGPRSREYGAMFEYPGSLGINYLRARRARRSADRWHSRLIEQIRLGQVDAPAQSVAYNFAWHRDVEGRLLDAQVAGVDLQNVLRATVAASVYVTFAALALHDYPACREKLEADGGPYAEWFAQEVRRFYPFFPAVAGRVREDFEWHGYRFPRGVRVVLDLYGTNHDPSAWDAPEEFRPERFQDWDNDAYKLIPQGGGDPGLNHRCPGDRISIELLKVAARFLSTRIRYDVPPQDLRLEWRNLPPLPRSRFVIQNVRERTPIAGRSQVGRPHQEIERDAARP
jgi:fatty-acid peroxygenase